MIDATIDYINTSIASAFTCGVSMQFAGKTKRVQRDKQTLNTVVMSNDSVTPFVIDSSFDIQLFHIEKKWTATKNPFGQYTWKCSLRMVGIAKTSAMIDKMIVALERNEAIILEEINLNSLEIIKGLWLADSWNPEHYAFAIDYNVNTVHVPSRTEAYKLNEVVITDAY